MHDNKHNESIASVETTEKNDTKYFCATPHSCTERGGRATRPSGIGTVAGNPLARVGNTVSYEDGSETTIIDGAGAADANVGRSVALVGSRLNNGDLSAESFQDGAALLIPRDRIISGLFDPTYLAPDYSAGAV